MFAARRENRCGLGDSWLVIAREASASVRRWATVAQVAAGAHGVAPKARSGGALPAWKPLQTPQRRRVALPYRPTRRRGLERRTQHGADHRHGVPGDVGDLLVRLAGKSFLGTAGRGCGPGDVREQPSPQGGATRTAFGLALPVGSAHDESGDPRSGRKSGRSHGRDRAARRAVLVALPHRDGVWCPRGRRVGGAAGRRRHRRRTCDRRLLGGAGDGRAALRPCAPPVASREEGAAHLPERLD